MATIRKRGELQWQAIVKRKGYPLQSKTFTTKKDAEVWARDIERDIDRGVFVDTREAQQTTLAELIKRYREDVLPSKRGKHFGPALKVLEENMGKYALVAISAKRVAEFRDKRLKAGLSASTIRKEINLLSKLIDLAGKEWGIHLPFNPCAMVSKPAEKNARERRLGGEEEKYLLAACAPQMALIVRLAVQSAARLGELLSLRWPDVDLDRRVMIIRGIDGRETKNDDAFRAVPLSSEAVAVFEELKALPRPKLDKRGDKDTADKPDDRVFPWWKAADSFNKSWVRALERGRKKYLEDCEESGDKPAEGFLVDLRFHDCRHEATSRLFERGVFDSMEVASITGHKTLAMLKRYTHLKAEDLAKKLV